MMRISLVTGGSLLVLSLCSWAACAPPPFTSGGSSSSSTGGTSAPQNYAEFCVQAYGSYCDDVPCERPEPQGARSECLAYLQTYCQHAAADVDRTIAAGKVRFNARNAGECAELYRGFYAAYNTSACADPSKPSEASAWLSAFYQVSCSPDGVASSEQFFEQCDRVLEGQVAPGGSCAGTTECAGDRVSCEGASDGGCGVCVASPISTLGGPCEVRTDAGLMLECPTGTTCAAGRCVEPPGTGDPCGGDLPGCEVRCGNFCEGASDGGHGVCRPLTSTSGRCNSSDIPCARGQSCVFPLVDAGFGSFPDFERGTCVPQAGAGETCGYGINYDLYAYYGRPGAVAYGADPVCAVDLVCTGPDGGAVDVSGKGTCVGFRVGARGERCDDGRTVCARLDVCDDFSNDGGAVCSARKGAGQRCERSTDCEGPLYCDNTDAGSTCRAEIAAGQSCDSNDECAGFNGCNFETNTCSDVPAAARICQ